MQGATDRSLTVTAASIFQSTLPMQGATQKPPEQEIWHKFQSTLPMQGATSNFFNALACELFQSTLPMQGATRSRCPYLDTKDFNPRSLCRERLDEIATLDIVLDISIHAPYAGSDKGKGLYIKKRRKFQSTLPMQGATSAPV